MPFNYRTGFNIPRDVYDQLPPSGQLMGRHWKCFLCKKYSRYAEICRICGNRYAVIEGRERLVWYGSYQNRVFYDDGTRVPNLRAFKKLMKELRNVKTQEERFEAAAKKLFQLVRTSPQN